MTLARSADTNGAVDHHTPDAAPVAHNRQVTDLQEWARQAQAAFTIAEMICGTEFCPQQFRGNPHKAAAAMMAGGELGFSPMTAINAFDVIQGATSLKARTMLAIVQSRGHFVRFVEKSATRVVMEGHRKGQPEGLQTAEWTIERAAKAGYVKKNPNYESKPQEMLTARATSEICRAIASDALLGIAYSSEELQDDPNLTEVHPDERDATPTPRAAIRGATRTSAADLIGKPAVEAVPAQDEDADVSTAVEMSTPQQRKRITELFNGADVPGDQRGRIVASLAREVTHTRELTHAEADDLVASMTDLGADGLAALATGGQQTAAQAASDDYDPAEDHASLFADEGGEQ